MVPSAMARTIAEECGIRTFLERSSPSGPPTRPVLSRNTSSGWVSSSSASRLPCCSWRRGKNGLVLHQPQATVGHRTPSPDRDLRGDAERCSTPPRKSNQPEEAHPCWQHLKSGTTNLCEPQL